LRSCSIERNGIYTDRSGDPWAADRAYSAGSWGYIGTTNFDKTKSPIGGTDDDPLYQDERRGSMEYRFDGLPNGVYQLELRFDELQNQKPGQRLFDVIAEGSLILPALDVSGEAGRLNALDKTFFMPVTDGTMNVRFIARQGSKEPIINAIRVTHRPDR
jgi:Malectin domain